MGCDATDGAPRFVFDSVCRGGAESLLALFRQHDGARVLTRLLQVPPLLNVKDPIETPIESSLLALFRQHDGARVLTRLLQVPPLLNVKDPIETPVEL
jgi:hypothetical protein